MKFLVVGIILSALSLSLVPPTALAAQKPNLSPLASKGGHYTPDSRYCNPGWVYDSLTNQGKSMQAFGPTYGDYNGTANNATMTLTATVSGAAKVTWGGTASLDANVIIAGVSATINSSVSLSLTATVTNTISITVPPNKTGYGNYGVWRQVTKGHYYAVSSDCTIGTDYGWVITYSPWYVGWNTWIGCYLT